eukprot:superscaffoldBa00001156_g9226
MITTLDLVMCKNQMRMKQVYRLPFERNTERLKELRYDYVQRVLDLDATAVELELIFTDEVGFNLAKRRGRGRNVIGQRATVEVPCQRGGNITTCAAINHHSVIHHCATLGPYDTARLITFLDTPHNILIQPDQMAQSSPGMLSSGTIHDFDGLEVEELAE